MSATETVEVTEAAPEKTERAAGWLHRAWQVSVSFTIAAGLFHLFNLVGDGRLDFGAALLTPFRLFFFLSWAMLVAGFVSERRLPRLEGVDYLIAAVAAVFVVRGLFHPESLSIVVNWVATGAGVFYLVRHGIRDIRDVRVVLFATVAAILGICLFGLVEYVFKSNPLFNSIEVNAIGMDTRIGASNQFYRIRSLVGHPGFLGAIVLASVPLAMLVFWRRRLMMAGVLAMMAAVLFLTFSRGTWLLAAIALVPLLAIRARYWFRRNIKWILPLALVPLLFVAFDYFNREEVSIETPGYHMQESGLAWNGGRDGPVAAVSGESTGVQPLNHFIYFDVGDSFMRNTHDPVTVIIHYFDKGGGSLRLDYDAWSGDGKGGIYKATTSITKTNTRQWTSVAFYLKDPRFDGRENNGADFRIVDDDNEITVDEVVVQKGRLNLPSVVAQQWMSRAGSFTTRASLYPFAWNVLMAHPLGVGLYNTPGTNGHAVDSLPLTWMMEFGWLGLPLILGLVAIFIIEGIRVWKAGRGSAAILYVALVLLLLHGAFLMILYDKPSLVLAAIMAALYTVIRPWRPGGRAIDADNENCML